MVRRVGFWAAIVVTALVVASPASAATWVVYAGQPSPPPADAPATADQHRFFPRVLHVHRGDRVRFVSASGLHTATFLGTRPESRFPLMKLDPAGGVYDAPPDAAGGHFWFEGKRKYVYNMRVLYPRGTRTVADDRYHNSGALAGTSYTFRFTKVGRFRVLCLLHPGMAGVVVVHPRGERIPTAADVRSRVARQVARGWERAKFLATVDVDHNSVFAGVGGRVTVNSFFPQELRVALNDIVDFVNMAPSEVHNIAFGPREWIEDYYAATELFPFPSALRGNQVTPLFVYGSEYWEPRTEPPTYHFVGSNAHGNGLLVSPLFDGIPGRLPNRVRVMFMEEGEFAYYCLYHGPTMSGLIRVVRR